MRAWLRGEGTIVCELPDGSRRAVTAAEYFAGPHLTDQDKEPVHESDG